MSSHTNNAAKNLVGPALRKRRYDLKLSQAQVAARCQIHGWNASRDMIAAIESQIRYVTDQEVVQLAKALKTPFPNLFPPD